MVDKYIAAVAGISLLLVAGCQTVAGTTSGVAQGVVSTTEGAVTGATKDVTATAGMVEYLDDWIQKTLW
ncbi:MAG TPA: hypothetical protein PKL77_01315 [Candidatus Omnitrophota bacterium]|nr:hypothetical protein [Candidatus Omnitrophota bacterium]HPT07149.1 hypothetical protein [Candidatus Omnitrophota bacterium]